MPARTLAPESQEVRALLRRIPDGLKATLACLAGKPVAERERIMTDLARVLGKEVLPLFRAAAQGTHEELAASAIRLLPVFGTRAAADILVEVHNADPESPRAALAREAGVAFRARGVQAAIPEPSAPEAPPKLTLRDTWVGAPERVGTRTVVARLQDEYGVWHAIIVLWNDQAGVKEGFMRPLSRHEWDERAQRMEDRGTPQVQCPPDYARWEIAQARRLNEETGLDLEENLADWDAYVGPPPADYQPPNPEVLLEGADDATRQEWLEEGRKLHRSTDASRWFLEAADCVEWTQRWTSFQNRFRYHSAGPGNEKKYLQEIRELLAAATDDLFNPRLRELYQSRLIDLARVLMWRRLEPQARWAAAAAVALRDGVAPSKIPVLTAIVETSLRTTELLIAQGEDLERLRYRPLRKRQY